MTNIKDIQFYKTAESLGKETIKLTIKGYNDFKENICDPIFIIEAVSIFYAVSKFQKVFSSLYHPSPEIMKNLINIEYVKNTGITLESIESDPSQMPLNTYTQLSDTVRAAYVSESSKLFYSEGLKMLVGGGVLAYSVAQDYPNYTNHLEVIKTFSGYIDSLPTVQDTMDYIQHSEAAKIVENVQSGFYGNVTSIFENFGINLAGVEAPQDL